MYLMGSRSCWLESAPEARNTAQYRYTESADLTFPVRLGVHYENGHWEKNILKIVLFHSPEILSFPRIIKFRSLELLFRCLRIIISFPRIIISFPRIIISFP